MADRAWWVTAIQWSLWGVAMTLVMGWLGRTRLKHRSKADAKRLVHPVSTLIIGGVGFAFFVALTILSNVFANETTTWWTTTIFVGFAVLSAQCIWSYFVDKHEVSDEGIAYSTILGAHKNIRWDDVVSLRYYPFLKWFHVQSRGGQVARLSVMLMGLPEFARLALEKAPKEAFESFTEEVLRATAEGFPPSVWN